jgi:hypothetical protein
MKWYVPGVVKVALNDVPNGRPAPTKPEFAASVGLSRVT